jgi:large subunit ribosomal protein L24
MTITKSKITKGDIVLVITGDEKGKKGEVLKVYPRIQKLSIKNLNIVKKHKKKTSYSEGSISYKEGLIHISNVGLWDDAMGKVCKVGFDVSDNAKKLRVNKKTKKNIDKNF